ncbi:MAG: SGNH/GDSL hydrolase family protein [Myxococcota bacterium]
MSSSSSSSRRTQRPDAASRLLLLTGALLAAALLAELALRAGQAWSLAGLGAVGVVHRASQDPELVYELVPGAETTRDGIPIRINADGFRDDPFPGPRRPGEFRVVVLGDSVAAGHSVALEEAFPQLLEARLRESLPAGARLATVLNFGVYGYATRQELRLLETRGLAYEPDLVILAYHLNDPDVADAGQARHFRRPPSYLLDELRGAARAWRLRRDAREYHRRIHADHGAEIAADFARLGTLSADSGVPVLVAVLPLFEWQRDYAWADLHRRLGELARANGLAFLDLAPRLVARPVAEVGHNVWHPNARGHALIADELFDWIRVHGRVRRRVDR